MIWVFIISFSVILLYLAYPFCLRIVLAKKQPNYNADVEVKGVSLILLSFNGIKNLKEKLPFLIAEMSKIPESEIIVIDDCSSDGTQEYLNKFVEKIKLRVILKDCQRGIPHTMNLGVETARFSKIIFCDQRQIIKKGVIKELTKPLSQENVGAVSSCISGEIGNVSCSLIRKYENLLKRIEGQSGDLIGVYGPLYAIKKISYSPLPENIILDDLYLSLNILKSFDIYFLRQCEIIDEKFEDHYNYKRTKRYFMGFIQLLHQPNLIKKLSLKQKVMLFWHKYLRLIIPFFLFVSYVCSGLFSFYSNWYLFLFALGTLFIIVSLLPTFSKTQITIRNFLKINLFYLISFWDIVLSEIIFKKKGNSDFRTKKAMGDGR